MRALFIIACLVATASVGAAHDDAVDISIAGREADCPGGATFCFVVTSGDPSAITAGSAVHLTFTNEGASVHNAYVTDGARADPDHRDTDAGAAFARTSDAVDEGASEELEFTVPASASSLYVWCDVAGHEQLGMYVEWPVSGASMTDADNDGAMEDTDAENASPSPWGLVAVALASAALFASRGSRPRQP